MSDVVFEDGAFVWFWPKLEARPIVARVLYRKGSGYHLAWASLGGNQFEYVADPDELLVVVPCPPDALHNPVLPPEAHRPAPELREPPSPPVTQPARKRR